MTGKSKQSLAEFAEAHPLRRGSKTWMETNLPPEVLEECVQGWRSGLRATTLERWLKSQGYAEVTSSRIGSYFSGHPVEGL